MHAIAASRVTSCRLSLSQGSPPVLQPDSAWHCTAEVRRGSTRSCGDVHRMPASTLRTSTRKPKPTRGSPKPVCRRNRGLWPSAYAVTPCEEKKTPASLGARCRGLYRPRAAVAGGLPGEPCSGERTTTDLTRSGQLPISIWRIAPKGNIAGIQFCSMVTSKWRPATPGSVAGVARQTTRRAVLRDVPTRNATYLQVRGTRGGDTYRNLGKFKTG